MRTGSAFCRFRGGQHGNAVVEFALISPILLYGLLAAIDLGTSIWEQAQVGNAARAGALYAAANAYNSAGITTAAQDATGLTITVTPSTYCGCAGAGSISQQSCGTLCFGGGTAATYVQVTTKANYTPISPVNWGKSMVSLSATTLVRTN